MEELHGSEETLIGCSIATQFMSSLGEKTSRSPPCACLVHKASHELLCLVYYTWVQSAVCEMAWKVVITCQSWGLGAIFPGSESIAKESLFSKSVWGQRWEDDVLGATSSARALHSLDHVLYYKFNTLQREVQPSRETGCK